MFLPTGLVQKGLNMGWVKQCAPLSSQARLEGKGTCAVDTASLNSDSSDERNTAFATDFLDFDSTRVKQLIGLKVGAQELDRWLRGMKRRRSNDEKWLLLQRT